MINPSIRACYSGTDQRSGKNFAVNENIYGPFEAGFGSQQNFILAALGCATGKCYVAGGIDTYTAEQIVAQDCSVTLPRIANNEYVSLLDECGGHTGEYHFHERLSCLYVEEGQHSTQVGVGSDGKFLYGKWESSTAGIKPLLDACGGHFGVTPESAGASVYHYHIQSGAPFTFGCFGPDRDGNGNEVLVTLDKCREVYSGCGNGNSITVSTTTGTFEYDPWCPCFDGEGSNIGTAQLAAFATSQPTNSPTSQPTSHPTSQRTSHPTSQPVAALTSSPTSQPTTGSVLGPAVVPSTGGPAGCWLQILNTAVSSSYYCATKLNIHLAHGSSTAPADALEVHAYSIVPPTATLVAVRPVSVDVNNQDE